MSNGILEIDKNQLKKNIQLIRQEMPPEVSYFCVVKDNAFGHGAELVAKEACLQGADYLMVSCLQEAIDLKQQEVPIFILYERFEKELEYCVERGFTLQVQSLERAKQLSQLAQKQQKKLQIHLKVDTGLGRYGVHWQEAANLYFQLLGLPHLEIAGIFSHLAQSDELDKSYANLQHQRFQQVLNKITKKGKLPRYIHLCNSGGYLDLPHCHYNAVRIGILNLGVYPSKVCRRILGLAPVMKIKTKVVHTKTLYKGEKLGYGMHFLAEKDTRVAILPLGYADGIPRLKNQGKVLLAGEFAPIIGGVSMDAVMVDISNIPEVKVGDEAVLLGKQKEKEITIHYWSELAGTVCYDNFTQWRGRIQRTSN